MRALLLATMIATGLEPNQIRTVVMANTREFRDCYDAEHARDPNLKGTVTLGWTITPAGAVERVTVKQSTLANARVERCLVGVVGSLRFPTADSPTDVAAYPLKFGVAP